MTKHEIADHLCRLATGMQEISVEMDYYGGFFDVRFRQHAQELYHASKIIDNWVDTLREGETND
jgi:hypothetical protein